MTEETIKNEWRDKINPIYFVPNKTKTKETDITKLKDSEKLVLLQGLKEVAALRGFKSVNYDVIKSERDYVCVKCTIHWIPLQDEKMVEEQNKIREFPLPTDCQRFFFNAEIAYSDKVFSALADAHADNVEGMAQKFLTTTAENRAFSRCVRNFLRIDVVSDSEIDKTTDEKNENMMPSPKDILKKALEDKGKTFLDILEILKSKKIDTSNYKNVDDLENGHILSIMTEIKRKKPRKAKELAAVQEVKESTI